MPYASRGLVTGISTGVSMTPDGWQQHPGVKETKEYLLGASFDISTNPYGDTDITNEIKYDFAHKFARQLIEDKAILIEATRESYNQRTVYNASLTVVPRGMSHTMRTETKFKYKEQWWSDKDIKEALANTFPERLL